MDLIIPDLVETGNGAGMAHDALDMVFGRDFSPLYFSKRLA